MKKRIVPLLLCLALALTVLLALPGQADAATAQETGNAILKEALALQGTFTDGCSAECPHCGETVTWKALSTNLTAYVQDAGHYYLQGDTTQTAYQTFSQIKGNICLHMNGFDFSAGHSRGTFIASSRVLTIMGSGTFSSKAVSGARAVVYANGGTVNIYGTTIKTEANNGEPALSLYTAATTMNLWGATLDVGTNPLISTNGTVNLYNCTAIGGTAVEQDDPNGGSGSTAKLNLYDSTVPGVKSDIGTVTVSGATKITGTGLELAAGKTIDPSNLTEGASIAIGSEGAFTAAGKADYAKYFTSATTGLKMIAKQDGALANLGAEEFGYEVVRQAKAMEGKFPTDGTSTYVADCPACGLTNVTWKPLVKGFTNSEGNADSTAFEDKGHYFIPYDLTLNGQIFQYNAEKTVCLHTNGKTWTDNTYRITIVNAKSILNVMGTGAIHCNTKGNRGVLYSNNASTINVYGTTIKNTATEVAVTGNACVTLYNTNGVANFWNATLVGSSVSPVILTNGVVNLYSSTATGPAAQVGGYSNQPDSKAALNLYDSTVSGVDQKTGKITVSGASKITGTGLSLAVGKTIDPSKLTAGAEIMIADECVITGSGMADYVKYFKAVKNGQEITASSDGVLRCWVPKALLVDANGNETVVDDILTDWTTGNYAYIKLYGNETFNMDGQDIMIDLNGFDLTVTGTGNIQAFDTANDTYDKSACGTILNNGTVTFTEAVAAPNGNRYVTVKESNRATAHRLQIKLTSVSLRTSVAGLYYKAKYTCDSVLAEKVKAYGMIVSVDNVPGADYTNDGTDINKYTVAAAPFQSGVTATSGSVFGIMKDGNDPAVNDANARIPIYANAYIDLGNGPIVADIVNPGKTVDADGFSGTALSLYDVLQKLDDAYNSYNTTTRLQLDDFYAQWKDKGMDWSFDNIGQTAGTADGIDNSDIELKFAAGTTNAECPVCKKTVTWTALNNVSLGVKMTGHYYLTGDLTYTGTASAIFWNEDRTTDLCVHLNGHNLTATKTRGVHGSSGRVNLMGNGIVTGYQSTKELGAAVMVNNYIETQSVHLYGGTYQKSKDSLAAAATVAINAAGGELNIYKGATVNNTSGTAIFIKTATNVNTVKSNLSLFGAVINGDVILSGNNPSVNKAVATTEFVDCTINGNVNVAQNNQVYIAGAPVIRSVTLASETVLITKVLTEGASIGITNNGIFTAQSESVKNYTTYFHGAGAADVITVRDNALHCGPDYAGDLKFQEGTTNAMCPVCAKVVTWEAVDGTKNLDNSTEKKTKHYYLTKDATYTGGKDFINPGHGSHTVCFHLNGHDLTLNARLIYGGTSVSNIMGTGVITGIRNDTYSPGGVVQINTSAESGTINLYAGTYRHGENGTYSANDFAISISGNGGTVNIYEDALVEANSNGKAIYVGNSNMRSSKLGIYGTVNGKVYSEGAKTFTTTITVDNGTVNGTMDLNGVSDLVVGHAAKIQLLDMEETSVVTMDTMTAGADIVVKYDGIFTKTHSSAAQYAQYFTGYNPGDTIVVKDGALRCKPGYEEELKVDAEGKAFCPVCKKTVEWTPVSSGENYLMTEDGKHYYLTNDIVYNGVYDGEEVLAFIRGATKSGASTCFHLNGHNITATQAHGVFGGYGVLNIMGEGVITGYAVFAKYGGAIHVNNSVVGNCVKLYSGTYRNAENSVEGSAVATLWIQGSGLTVYEDADISNLGKLAIYTDISKSRDTNLELYGATINGDVEIGAPVGTNNKYAKVILEDVTINGNMTIAAGNEVTMRGKTCIDLLTVAQNQLVTFENMKSGSALKISANGIFSGVMDKADEWVKYITCADEGDWIIVRDKQFYQEAKREISMATDNDKNALLTTYTGATLRYGEMHNHTNSGPFRDDGTGYTPSTGADGKKSLTEWIAEMDRLKLDFAFIVDHGMSIHMYNENFLPDYFIGGTEPGTTITDSNASQAKPHYNMLFAYPEELESIFFKWESKFKPMKWNLETRPTAQTPSEEGYRVVYPTFTTSEFTQLAKDVYAAGGLLVQVHPKYDSYIYSDDPLDYYFADYTGLEISTGNGKAYNMMYKDNDEAYELWVDLLELGKKVFATAGSDGHSLPDYSGLTAIYTVNDHKDDYMAAVRAGNIAPGWVGIRMNVNGTAMGGETSFDGQRLQFSVGEMYNAGEVDYCKTPAVYVEGHTYSVALYDDGGLLMKSVIDPTQMTYFAVDCDNDAKFYRVVVWDETDNERVGVSNPIWNTAAVEE